MIDCSKGINKWCMADTLFLYQSLAALKLCAAFVHIFHHLLWLHFGLEEPHHPVSMLLFDNELYFSNPCIKAWNFTRKVEDCTLQWRAQDAIKNKEYSLQVFEDYQIAFDTISHYILQNKLYKFGIKENVLNLIKKVLFWNVNIKYVCTRNLYQNIPLT